MYQLGGKTGQIAPSPRIQTVSLAQPTDHVSFSRYSSWPVTFLPYLQAVCLREPPIWV